MAGQKISFQAKRMIGICWIITFADLMMDGSGDGRLAIPTFLVPKGSTDEL